MTYQADNASIKVSKAGNHSGAPKFMHIDLGGGVSTRIEITDEQYNELVSKLQGSDDDGFGLSFQF